MKKIVGIVVVILFVASVIFVAYFGMNLYFTTENNNPVAIEFAPTQKVVDSSGVERQEETYIDPRGVLRVNVYPGETIYLSWFIIAEWPDLPLTDEGVSFVFSRNEIFIVNEEEGSVFISLQAWLASFEITIRPNANTRVDATISITPMIPYLG